MQVEDSVKRSKKEEERTLQSQLDEFKATNSRLTIQVTEQARTIDWLNKNLLDLQQSSSNVGEQQRRIETLLLQINDLENHLRSFSEERETLVR